MQELCDRITKRLNDSFDYTDAEAARIAVDEVLAYRRERFQAGNDSVWGPGNWHECGRCRDSAGFPAYEHVSAHGGEGD